MHTYSKNNKMIKMDIQLNTSRQHDIPVPIRDYEVLKKPCI